MVFYKLVIEILLILFIITVFSMIEISKNMIPYSSYFDLASTPAAVSAGADLSDSIGCPERARML